MPTAIDALAPQYLYKYREHGSFLRDILVNHKFWFSSKSQLNDPFDCEPNYQSRTGEAGFRELFERIVKDEYPDLSRQQRRYQVRQMMATSKTNRRNNGLPATPPNIADILQRHIEKTGILSLTDDPVNLLMWTHYANNGRGVCVRLDMDAMGRGCAQPMQYLEERPVVNPAQPTIELADVILFTKAIRWQYESEWRMIANKAVGLHEFDPRWITGVVLGHGISDEHEAEIRQWAEEGKLDIEWERVRPDRQTYELVKGPA